MVTLWVYLVLSCAQRQSDPKTAQQIVDKAIGISGGKLYKTSRITFDFRNRSYIRERENGHEVLKRITVTDSMMITDVRGPKFQRYLNDSLISLPDSLATSYSNSVNSVHYFAYLPHGLNDVAVNKRLLDTVGIAGRTYYRIQVTFDEEGGGKDFEDIYLYWFDTETYKPHYLAYEFHVDGGGQRFRKAFNERYVSGLRFVDYENYKPRDTVLPLGKIDSLFTNGALELLSTIELRNIQVSPDSYN